MQNEYSIVFNSNIFQTCSGSLVFAVDQIDWFYEVVEGQQTLETGYLANL